MTNDILTSANVVSLKTNAIPSLRGQFCVLQSILIRQQPIQVNSVVVAVTTLITDNNRTWHLKMWTLAFFSQFLTVLGAID